MHLDPNSRDQLVDEIIGSLKRAEAQSTVKLRGSLADGRGDVYSDIDIRWEIPDAHFALLIERVEEILSTVRPLESIRSDPNFQNSDRRRLLFLRFEDVPLFWRVDLEVFAKSLNGDDRYDVNNPAARGDDWSPTHSALMNAIAAIKALMRGQEKETIGLLKRGFERLHLHVPPVPPQKRILALVDAIASMDEDLGSLISRIKDLIAEMFGNT